MNGLAVNKTVVRKPISTGISGLLPGLSIEKSIKTPIPKQKGGEQE